MTLMVKILLVLMTLLLLPPLLLHRMLLRGKPELRWCRRLLWSLALLLFVGVVVFLLSGFSSGSPEWLWRMFFPLLFGSCVSELLIVVGALLSRLFKKSFLLSRGLLGLGLLAAAINIIIVTMAYFIGNKRIDVKEYEFCCQDLPEAFDGFRVVHFSDLHLGTYGKDTARVAQLIDKVLEQHGDMILFTGDLVNFSSAEAQAFTKDLARLSAPYGVYSILGNHDYAVYAKYESRREQVSDILNLVKIEQDAGWTVLRNENAMVEKDSAKIALIGVENDGRPPFPQLADLKKAQLGLPDQLDGHPLFKILLTHDPSHWRRSVLGETDAQLTLAGHTHGMQFKLLGWSPASMLYKEWGGQYYEGNRSLVVSIGLGLGSVPFRFGAWSEVCVITLRKK